MFLKNLPPSTVLDLKDLVDIRPGQIVSKTLVQNSQHSITLFAFAQGEEISTHASSGDALLSILEGTAKITIGEEVFTLLANQTILMPANIPHALLALDDFKAQLIVIFTKGE